MRQRLFILLILAMILSIFCVQDVQADCLTGAFMADRPTKKDIARFKASYGKKPYLVMIFVDWGRFVDEKIIKDVYSENCILFVTWEPWRAARRKGINYDKILSGRYDRYIQSFTERLKAIKKIVFLRFGHEMNGDWYPWSGIRIGKDKFKAIYRYVKDIFDSKNADNVKWVFSINWQDVPEKNNYRPYYPGDDDVDYIGIDGYNWGNTQAWSKWMSFEDIFLKRYAEVTAQFKKPVLISEFSSTSSGGDKSRWLKEAMEAIKRMPEIKAFVLFNVDKETDWNFPPDKASGKELNKQLEDGYFRDRD